MIINKIATRSNNPSTNPSLENPRHVSNFTEQAIITLCPGQIRRALHKCIYGLEIRVYGISGSKLPTRTARSSGPGQVPQQVAKRLVEWLFRRHINVAVRNKSMV